MIAESIGISNRNIKPENVICILKEETTNSNEDKKAYFQIIE
jgi:hypothetical protein